MSKETVLKKDFSSSTINEKWVTGLPYINTVNNVWCYLASVIDLYSRKIIEQAISKSIDTKLAIQAVKNALLLQKP